MSPITAPDSIREGPASSVLSAPAPCETCERLFHLPRAKCGLGADARRGAVSICPEYRRCRVTEGCRGLGKRGRRAVACALYCRRLPLPATHTTQLADLLEPSIEVHDREIWGARRSRVSRRPRAPGGTTSPRPRMVRIAPGCIFAAGRESQAPKRKRRRVPHRVVRPSLSRSAT
jgi:hypothetical protein